MLQWVPSWIVVTSMDSLSLSHYKGVFYLWKIHLMFLRLLLILDCFKIYTEWQYCPVTHMMLSFYSIPDKQWLTQTYWTLQCFLKEPHPNVSSWEWLKISGQVCVLPIPNISSGHYLMFIEQTQILLPHNRLSEDGLKYVINIAINKKKNIPIKKGLF